MTADTIARLVDELTRNYSGASSTVEGSVTLVKLPSVFFPNGCRPDHSPALVLLDPQQPAPRLLLKQLPSLKNGCTPRSVGSETIAGEGWFSFSYNQPWNEISHTALQFVEGGLRRFALNE
jgi:hypothetical protein